MKNKATPTLGRDTASAYDRAFAALLYLVALAIGAAFAVVVLGAGVFDWTVLRR